ncbi:hypothetical protein [Geodermatophilus sp. SYSU D01119]
MASAGSPVWHELHWRRPLDVDRAASVLRAWATDRRSPVVSLEARARPEGVRYFLGAWPEALPILTAPLHDLTATAATKATLADRAPVQAVGSLRLNTRHRPLRVTAPEADVFTVLAALTRLRPDEELVLQLLLGPRRIPLAVPTASPSSTTAPWYVTAWHGDGAGEAPGPVPIALALAAAARCARAAAPDALAAR